MPAAEPEVELVAQEARHGSDADHGRQCQMTTPRREAGQQQHGLAFKQTTHRQHPVAVVGNQAGQVHRGGVSCVTVGAFWVPRRTHAVAKAVANAGVR